MDESVRVGMFGGVVGRLVRDATAPGTAFTGFVLGVILLASGFVCRMVQADVIGQLFGQIVMAAALARFALNGYSGEYRGTLLSTAGGTWPQALMVAGRYLTLQLMWVVPVFFLGWSAISSALRPETNSVALNGGAGGGTGLLPILGVFTSGAFLWSIGLFFFGMLLLPPVFLIVAVRAEKFEHIFRGLQGNPMARASSVEIIGQVVASPLRAAVLILAEENADSPPFQRAWGAALVLIIVIL